MLTDAPYAFGETMAEAQARTVDEWNQYIEDTMIAPRHSAFIAFDQAGTCGFIAGDKANPQAPPDTVLVSRLWVASRQRGIGLGRKLMDTVTTWARDHNAQFIALGVTEMNVNAIKFYEHLGYIDTGFRLPLSWDPTKQIFLLGQKL
jgi:GNAT superfamily N-acetyltransferase